MSGRAALLAASVGAGAGAGTSWAQTAPPSPLPPAADAPDRSRVSGIIITAQYRAEAAQTVPIALSAFSADGLERRGVTSPVDLGHQISGLVASHNVALGSANSYFIRGFGSTESIATTDPAVATYLDGVYIGRQGANDFSFFDIDRIEVLRGPQGTLYGRNTSGGAINVNLRPPSDKIEGYVEGSYGAYNNRGGRASLNIPFSPDIALKLSGYYQNDNGYVRNTATGERLNDNDGAGARIAIRARISSALTWNGSVALIQSKADNLLNFTCDPANPGDCNGRFASTGLSRRTTGYAPLLISGAKAAFGLGNEANTAVYTSRFDYAGDHATLSVITGYVDLRQKYAIDLADGRAFPSVADPSPAVRSFPLGGYTILNDSTGKQFTQEVRLAGSLFGDNIDYVAGAFVLNEDNRTDFADLATSGTPATPRLIADRLLVNHTDSIAVYAQADWKVTDRLKLTAGVRYTDETKTLTIADNRAACLGSSAGACLNQGSLVAATGVAIPTRQKARETTPRFAISYSVQPDLLVFASATRGFQSGGWNGRAISADALLPYGTETLWSYEAGVRSEWWNHRLRANLTGFFVDADNFQAPSALLAGDASPRFVTQNVGGYRNKGVELELTAVPIDGLNLSASLTWQDAGYRLDKRAPAVNAFGVKSVGQQQVDCRAELSAGRIALSPAATNAADCAAGIVTAAGGIARPVRTPRVSIVAGASYDWPIPAAGIILTPSAGLDYRSAYETGTANATIFAGSVTAGGVSFPANPSGGAIISGSRTASYVLVDAALTLRTDDNNWTLAMSCSNCFDRAFAESSLAGTSYLNPPRRWQLRLKRVF